MVVQWNSFAGWKVDENDLLCACHVILAILLKLRRCPSATWFENTLGNYLCDNVENCIVHKVNESYDQYSLFDKIKKMKHERVEEGEKQTFISHKLRCAPHRMLELESMTDREFKRIQMSHYPATKLKNNCLSKIACFSWIWHFSMRFLWFYGSGCVRFSLFVSITRGRGWAGWVGKKWEESGWWGRGDEEPNMNIAFNRIPWQHIWSSDTCE